MDPYASLRLADEAAEVAFESLTAHIPIAVVVLLNVDVEFHLHGIVARRSASFLGIRDVRLLSLALTIELLVGLKRTVQLKTRLTMGTQERSLIRPHHLIAIRKTERHSRRSDSAGHVDLHTIIRHTDRRLCGRIVVVVVIIVIAVVHRQIQRNCSGLIVESRGFIMLLEFGGVAIQRIENGRARVNRHVLDAVVIDQRCCQHQRIALRCRHLQSSGIQLQMDIV